MTRATWQPRGSHSPPEQTRYGCLESPAQSGHLAVAGRLLHVLILRRLLVDIPHLPSALPVIPSKSHFAHFRQNLMGNNPSRSTDTRSRSAYSRSRSFSKGGWNNSARRRIEYGRDEDLYDDSKLGAGYPERQAYAPPFSNVPSQAYYGRACHFIDAIRTLDPYDYLRAALRVPVWGSSAVGLPSAQHASRGEPRHPSFYHDRRDPYRR